MTGLVERSPRHEQTGLLAVVDDVSGTALSPSRRTGGADLFSLSPEVRANSFPRRLGNRRRLSGPIASTTTWGVVPSSRGARALGGGTGGASLLCRAAVIFQFGLTARELGSDLRGQGTKGLPCVVVLHAQQHEASDAREVVNHSQG